MNYMDDFCSVLRRRADAVAFVEGSGEYKEVQGRVLFYEIYRSVLVRAEIMGLPEGEMPCRSPIFGFHIHGGGKCVGDESDPFADAGTHYNPYDCRHPYHAGDLPPLFGVDGDAFLMFLTNRFSVSEVLGKTVVIHSEVDDFTTRPSGNSGEKIACGVITPTDR